MIYFILVASFHPKRYQTHFLPWDDFAPLTAQTRRVAKPWIPPTGFSWVCQPRCLTTLLKIQCQRAGTAAVSLWAVETLPVLGELMVLRLYSYGVLPKIWKILSLYLYGVYTNNTQNFSDAVIYLCFPVAPSLPGIRHKSSGVGKEVCIRNRWDPLIMSVLILTQSCVPPFLPLD